MPNATSPPSASSDRTGEPAPEVATGEATAGAGVAAAATVAGLARWASVSGVGLVMAVPFRSAGLLLSIKKGPHAENGTGPSALEPLFGRWERAHISTRVK